MIEHVTIHARTCLKIYQTEPTLTIYRNGIRGATKLILFTDKLNLLGYYFQLMSLKPFKKNDPAYIRGICREVFTQWAPLIRHADQVSVMMWTADGSEILNYTGDPTQRLEWGMYIGNPNSGRAVGSEPDAPLSIHDRAFLYMPNPPEYTLGDLRFIVQTIKEEGRRITGKPVRVGATFDPGPEFAKSDFKYKKHPEICMAATMGSKSFVC